MKQKLTPRWVIIKLTGLLFAAYAAYNIFIIIRDHTVLSSEGIIISVLVAFLFSILAAYALTSGIMPKNILFLIIRRTVYILALLAIFVLKLRMVDKVNAYIDQDLPYTIIYAFSYYLTQAGLLILFIYYAFIRIRPLLFTKVYVILPIITMILFLGGLILEIILFFVYGIGLEANVIRTVVMRPVFYLGFIGLSAYYLFPPRLPPEKSKKQSEESEKQPENSELQSEESEKQTENSEKQPENPGQQSETSKE